MLKAYFADLASNLPNLHGCSDEATTGVQMVGRGLSVLLANQTADERATKSTQHLNGKGFNGRDAEFGTSLAEAFIRSNTLSRKQCLYGAKMCAKYSRQLTEAGIRVPGVEVYGE